MADEKSAECLAIVGATLIDGNGGPPAEGSVILIRGKRIVAVGDRSLEVPSSARRIDAAGKYVIPGLMDANVHLVLDIWPLSLVQHEGRYDQLAVEAAQMALRSGVTTVFDTWGPREELIRARDAISRGTPGARIYLAGNIIGVGGPYSESFFPKGREVLFGFADRTNALWECGVGAHLAWKSAPQVRAIIREYTQSGVDFLKFALTTHVGEMQHLQFSPRVVEAIVEEGHRAGLTVQTHTTTNEGLDLALRMGVDLMQHVDLTYGTEPLPSETIALMLERGIPGALLPETNRALNWYREAAAQVAFLNRYETMRLNVQSLIAAGVTLLLSTDGGVFSSNTLESEYWRSWVPPVDGLIRLGEGHFNWLQAVEDHGMRPMAALQAATRNIARAYRVDHDLGTVQPGKLADLLILGRNPLEAAAHYRSIEQVMKGGRIIDREHLPESPLLTAATQ